MVSLEMSASAVFSDRGEQNYTYNRSTSIEVERLASSLQQCYRSAFPALISPSGMSAIASVLQAHKSQYDRVIYPSEVYCDTGRLIRTLWPDTSYTYRVDDLPRSLEMMPITDRTIIFIESASNPGGYSCDWATALQEKRKQYPNLFVVVDNTWLTHVLHEPAELRKYADVVVLSLTKHYSNGLTIAGAVVAQGSSQRQHKIFKATVQWSKWNGLHVAPPVASIINEQLKTLKERLRRGKKATQLLLKELRQLQPGLFINHYPGTSVFAVTTQGDAAAMRQKLKVLAEDPAFGFKPKTSYEAAETRICPYIYSGDQDGTVVVRVAVDWQEPNPSVRAIQLLQLFA